MNGSLLEWVAYFYLENFKVKADEIWYKDFRIQLIVTSKLKLLKNLLHSSLGNSASFS